MTSHKTLTWAIIAILIYLSAWAILGLDYAHGATFNPDSQCNMLCEVVNNTNVSLSDTAFHGVGNLTYVIENSTDVVIKNSTYENVSVYIFIKDSIRVRIGKTILKGNSELHIYLVGKNNREVTIDTQLTVKRAGQYSMDMIRKYPSWLKGCIK